MWDNPGRPLRHVEPGSMFEFGIQLRYDGNRLRSNRDPRHESPRQRSMRKAYLLPLARLAWLVIAALNVGCYATQHLPLGTGARLDNATGVITRSGTYIEFAIAGATMTNDTLYATGRYERVSVPVDSIAEITQRKLSVRNTAGLVVGVGAVAFVVLLFAYLGNLANIE
jgi:hypothetical protein